MHIMSILCTVVDAVSLANIFTVLKVLMLNVTMLTMLLHLSNFALGLGSVTDFSNTRARAQTSAEHTSCSTE